VRYSDDLLGNASLSLTQAPLPRKVGNAVEAREHTLSLDTEGTITISLVASFV